MLFFLEGGGGVCLYNVLKTLGFHIVLDFGGLFCCCCFGFFFNKNPLEYIANKLPAVVEWYMYANNR